MTQTTIEPRPTERDPSPALAGAGVILTVAAVLLAIPAQAFHQSARADGIVTSCAAVGVHVPHHVAAERVPLPLQPTNPIPAGFPSAGRMLTVAADSDSFTVRDAVTGELVCSTGR